MEQLGISKLDLKRQNRMQILKILKQKGPTSRIDIAGTLELTRAAVTIITNELIEQGIITEVGEYKQHADEIHRGRKKILLDINECHKFAVGISIEQSMVWIGLSTLCGAVLDKKKLAINKETSFESILDFIKNSLNSIISNNCLSLSSILGVGVAVMPSRYALMKIDVVNKIAVFGSLKKILEKELKLNVVVDNYSKGAAMANIDFQPVKDPNRYNIAFLQYGSSFNFVVTQLNDPIKSYDNRTDFVDKMIINPCSKDETALNNCGRVVSEISSVALMNKAAPVFNITSTPFAFEKTKGNINELSRSMLFDAVNHGDKAFESIYNEHMRLLSVLINNLVYSTNPQKLVLHDFDFSEIEYLYFKEILESVAGANIANLINISILEDKNKFLAGAAIVIRELFFLRGGFAV